MNAQDIAERIAMSAIFGAEHDVLREDADQPDYMVSVKQVEDAALPVAEMLTAALDALKALVSRAIHLQQGPTLMGVHADDIADARALIAKAEAA